MQYIVLLSVLLIGANAQLSATRDQECKENESFQTCGTACEPTCGLPTPTFCTLQCVMGCQCNSGFFRRTSDNRCVEQKDCNVAANETIPIPPPATNLTCPVNEVSNECHNPCTEKKCPQKNAPQVNCLMACQVGCSCMDGFVRNNQGVCVKEAECPAIGSQTCGTNEEPNQCHNACFEKKCPVKPQPLVNCMEKCDIGCSCKKGFLRNRQGQCVNPTECPATGSTLTCSKNEEPNDCHNSCSEAKCPVNPQPFVRCMMRCEKACSCKKGLVRNRQGQCVKLAECPPTGKTDTNPCALVLCKPGHRCTMSTGQATCVPGSTDENPCNLVDCRTGHQCSMSTGKPTCVPETPPTGITCANVRCGFKGGCGMVEPVGCVGCKRQPQCLEEDYCRAQNCPYNEECVLVQVTCIRAPCNPIPTCRPKDLRLIKPLIQPRERRQAGPSCMTARCGTPAGCAMVRPSGCIGSTVEKGCELMPMCIHVNACASTSCLVGSQCVLHQVQCFTQPCDPIAQCEAPIKKPINRRCRSNEKFEPCKTVCSDTKCNEEPRFCPQVCTGGGCVCQEGFFRDNSGKCVTQNDCDAQKPKLY
ncbi:Follistatin-like domain-containing protein [Caenorhabditis elegans]|uniref:Follistatin-like domain-containing protein n=1 Tax=Caenorhabditis elegans TaxID=6239 RepID=L8E6L7_CAEEL|nr:Follistatin-like domain-containing protein [Caenorhabditis elegans]CCQ25689.1 Follistatin-like domain-containing protein [Caenorhabditis elegans]|eukprot:NP_001263928.1 Uncharacterized protein CELE_Y69H2.3 [Caenorhabditis elegans]